MDAAAAQLRGGLVSALVLVTLLLWCNHTQAAPMSGSFQQSKHTDVTHKWRQLAVEHISRHFTAHSNQRVKSVAKNVVLFIGDGMGLTTITAARILKGQLEARHWSSESRDKFPTAEEGQLAFETFDNVALSKTYNLDSQVGDSGACATALMSGVKANFETIGLSGLAKHDNCSSTFAEGARVSSIAEWAQQQGKSTGFVTTTRSTHATPAAFYAHSANRYWESDDKVPEEAAMCKDIARQLIEDEPGRNLNVIMGGGSRHFLTRSAASKLNKRSDGRNLIDAWAEDKKRRGLLGSFVANRKELLQLDTKQVDYLLGLFASNHMAHEIDRNKSDFGEPSLAEMTDVAVQVLKHNPNGFLLVVESGRIDHAHHQNNAARALTDTLALEAAIQQVLAHVNLSNTLLIVTADHSHVFTFGGSFPQRGNPILGLDAQWSDVDQQPYTTLLYGNGPGHRTNRANVNYTSTESVDYIQEAAVPRRWATHGGEDVPVYAAGVGADVFHGVIDQTFIPYAISYAACIGPMKSLCEEHVKLSEAKSGRCDRRHKVSPTTNSYIDRDQPDAGSSSSTSQYQKNVNLLDFIRYHWELSPSSGSSSHRKPHPLAVITLILVLSKIKLIL